MRIIHKTHLVFSIAGLIILLGIVLSTYVLTPTQKLLAVGAENNDSHSLAWPLRMPTRIPGLTSTPISYPDLVLLAVTMDPPIPQPDESFRLLATVKNQGSSNAGQFAVATTFEPGDHYSSAIVPNLAVGEIYTVELPSTVFETGIATVAVVIDLNNDVAEGPYGEENNKPDFSYRVDWKPLKEESIRIGLGEEAVLAGENPDLTYTTSGLAPAGDATIGVLSGVDDPSQVYFGLLATGSLDSMTVIKRDEITRDSIVAITLGSGERGIIYDIRPGDSYVELNYRLYPADIS